jgi:hypothetical protein
MTGVVQCVLGLSSTVTEYASYGKHFVVPDHHAPKIPETRNRPEASQAQS